MSVGARAIEMHTSIYRLYRYQYSSIEKSILVEVFVSNIFFDVFLLNMKVLSAHVIYTPSGRFTVLPAVHSAFTWLKPVPHCTNERTLLSARRAGATLY